MTNNWRKASYSQGASNCVEAGSWSLPENGACVEVGTGTSVVGVRDTKDRGAGPVLEFAPGAWDRFLAGIR